MMLPRRLWTAFAIASLAAIACGALIGALSGTGAVAWSRNAAAWAIGLVLALALGRIQSGRRPSFAILLVVLAGLAGTLAGADQDGVRRWIDAGPLHINVAALLLPVGLVAAARLGAWHPASLAFYAVALLILVAQPDASQATALAASAAVLLVGSPASRLAKAIAVALAAGLAAAAWLRPDPLEPIAEVELIFALAWNVGPALAALTAGVLAACCLTPLLAGRLPQPVRHGALALCAYMLVTALMPLFGAFPVPLVGIGMSFPVGLWLGIGWLAAAVREDTVRG